MERIFQSLSCEAREFQFGTFVPEVHASDITPLKFYRSYVATNQPVLIRQVCNNWPAFKKWNKQYFCEKFGDKDVTVAVTPNGYADAVAFDSETQQEYFVMPEERKMKFVEFWQALDHPKEYKGVFYMQRQNSNLTEDFPELLNDIESHIPWATEAFGTLPDAVNFWIGDTRAVTSLHKDPYENIYCVMQGYKDFILLPPTDRPWIPYKRYPTASYLEDAHGKFIIKPFCDKIDEDIKEVPWISIDPLNPDFHRYPSYIHASPLHVKVNAGDALYLPSLWYHHVRQSHACVAVNYWYDMQYDIKYVYHKFLEALVEKSNECKSEESKQGVDGQLNDRL